LKIKIDISMGEYIDKYSILIIKQDHELDVSKELEQYESLDLEYPGFDHYLGIMLAINEQLWDLEDVKRKGVERFSKDESNTAFLITQINDLRHETKKRIDIYFGSEITEKKSH
jgi:hypothetical protein|tara:strand:- start:773 stop:1114 length:342 start_codon:yes stop_codon:yes gene_type:complete